MSGALKINVINLVDKFRATGCAERKKSIRWPTKVTEDAVEDATERMQRGRNKSVKKLAVEIGFAPFLAKLSARPIAVNLAATRQKPSVTCWASVGKESYCTVYSRPLMPKLRYRKHTETFPKSFHVRRFFPREPPGKGCDVRLMFPN
ncbi:hypothetical protein ANN_13842 [Periplaneta americana]|uniref:Uncharacterized protein n=1 Tax=Periplaneta americana TaxID=6978 RepID=A0ABQ8SV79_PERAM|nr:hypothetical protein ANN_13842 [Periplaneta americana]